MATSNTPSATASASGGGIGFLGLLTIVLVVLKALGYINISWWLVFLPVMIGFGIFLLVLAILLVLAVISVRR